MPITLQCPCGKTLEVDDQYRGKKAKCPACGNVVLVEDQSETSIQAEPPLKSPTTIAAAVAKPVKQPVKRSIIPWLAAGGCGCVGLVLCIALTGAGSWYFGPKLVEAMKPAPAKIPVATPEQLEKVKDDFAKLGVRYQRWGEAGTDQERHVFVIDRGFPDRELKNLPKVPFAFTLNVLCNHVGNDAMRELVKHDTLTGLFLQNTGVTDDGMRELPKIKNLDDLILTVPKITAAGLVHIASIKKLEKLEVYEAPADDEAIRAWKGLKNLKRLGMMKCGVTQGCLQELKQFAQLTELYTDLAVNDEGARQLKDFANLEALSLNDSARLSDACLQEFKGMRKLKVLGLNKGNITDVGLRELRHFEKLESISLFGNPVTDAGVREIGNLKNLEGVYLGKTRVTDAGLKHLAGLESLKRLDLAETAITDAGMRHLRGLRNLRFLDLERTSIGDDGVEALMDLPQLRTLRAQRTQITDRGVKFISQMSSLEYLNVQDNLLIHQVSPLSDLKNLRTLSVSNLADDAVPGLLALSKLETLDIAGAKLTLDGARRLRDGLPRCEIRGLPEPP